MPSLLSSTKCLSPVFSVPHDVGYVRDSSRRSGISSSSDKSSNYDDSESKSNGTNSICSDIAGDIKNEENNSSRINRSDVSNLSNAWRSRSNRVNPSKGSNSRSEAGFFELADRSAEGYGRGSDGSRSRNTVAAPAHAKAVELAAKKERARAGAAAVGLEERRQPLSTTPPAAAELRKPSADAAHLERHHVCAAAAAAQEENHMLVATTAGTHRRNCLLGTAPTAGLEQQPQHHEATSAQDDAQYTQEKEQQGEQQEEREQQVQRPKQQLQQQLQQQVLVAEGALQKQQYTSAFGASTGIRGRQQRLHAAAGTNKQQLDQQKQQRSLFSRGQETACKQQRAQQDEQHVKSKACREPGAHSQPQQPTSAGMHVQTGHQQQLQPRVSQPQQQIEGQRQQGDENTSPPQRHTRISKQPRQQHQHTSRLKQQLELRALHLQESVAAAQERDAQQQQQRALKHDVHTQQVIQQHVVAAAAEGVAPQRQARDEKVKRKDVALIIAMEQQGRQQQQQREHKRPAAAREAARRYHNAAAVLCLQPRFLPLPPRDTNCRSTRSAPSSRRHKDSSTTACDISRSNTKRNSSRGRADLHCSSSRRDSSSRVCSSRASSSGTSSSGTSSSNQSSGTTQRATSSPNPVVRRHLQLLACSGCMVTKADSETAMSVGQGGQEQKVTEGPLPAIPPSRCSSPAAAVLQEQQHALEHQHQHVLRQGRNRHSSAGSDVESSACTASDAGMCSRSPDKVVADSTAAASTASAAALAKTERHQWKSGTTGAACETPSVWSPGVEQQHLEMPRVQQQQEWPEQQLQLQRSEDKSLKKRNRSSPKRQQQQLKLCPVEEGKQQQQHQNGFLERDKHSGQRHFPVVPQQRQQRRCKQQQGNQLLQQSYQQEQLTSEQRRQRRTQDQHQKDQLKQNCNTGIGALLPSSATPCSGGALSRSCASVSLAQRDQCSLEHEYAAQSPSTSFPRADQCATLQVLTDAVEKRNAAPGAGATRRQSRTAAAVAALEEGKPPAEADAGVPGVAGSGTDAAPSSKSCKRGTLETPPAAAAQMAVTPHPDPQEATVHAGAPTAASHEIPAAPARAATALHTIVSPTSVNEDLTASVAENDGVPYAAATPLAAASESILLVADATLCSSRVAAAASGFPANTGDLYATGTAAADVASYSEACRLAAAAAVTRGADAAATRLAACRGAAGEDAAVGEEQVAAPLPTHVEQLLRRAAALQPYLVRLLRHQQQPQTQQQLMESAIYMPEDLPQQPTQEEHETLQGLPRLLLRAFRHFSTTGDEEKGDLSAAAATLARREAAEGVTEEEEETVWEGAAASVATVATHTREGREIGVPAGKGMAEATGRRGKAAARKASGRNAAPKSDSPASDADRYAAAAAEGRATAAAEDRIGNSTCEDFYKASVALMDIISSLVVVLQEERHLLLQQDDFFFHRSGEWKRQQQALAAAAAAHQQQQMEHWRQARAAVQELKRQQQALHQAKRELLAEQRRRRRLSGLLLQSQHAIRQQELLNDKLKKRLLSRLTCRTAMSRPVKGEKVSPAAAPATAAGVHSPRAAAAQAGVQTLKTGRTPTPPVAATGYARARIPIAREAGGAAAGARARGAVPRFGAIEGAVADANNGGTIAAEGQKVSVYSVERSQCRCACPSAKQPPESGCARASVLAEERAAFETALHTCHCREVELLRVLRQQQQLIVMLENEVQSGRQQLQQRKGRSEQLQEQRQQGGHQHLQGTNGRQGQAVCGNHQRQGRRQQQQTPDSSPSEEEGQQPEDQGEVRAVRVEEKERRGEGQLQRKGHAGSHGVTSGCISQQPDDQRQQQQQQRREKWQRREPEQQQGRLRRQSPVRNSPERSTTRTIEDCSGNKSALIAATNSPTGGSGSRCNRSNSGSRGKRKTSRSSRSTESGNVNCGSSSNERKKRERQRDREAFSHSPDLLLRKAAEALRAYCRIEQSSAVNPAGGATTARGDLDQEPRLAAAGAVVVGRLLQIEKIKPQTSSSASIKTKVDKTSGLTTRATSCSSLLSRPPTTASSPPAATRDSSASTKKAVSSSIGRMTPPEVATLAGAGAATQSPARPVEQSASAADGCRLRRTACDEVTAFSFLPPAPSPAHPPRERLAVTTSARSAASLAAAALSDAASSGAAAVPGSRDAAAAFDGGENICARRRALQTTKAGVGTFKRRPLAAAAVGVARAAFGDTDTEDSSLFTEETFSAASSAAGRSWCSLGMQTTATAKETSHESLFSLAETETIKAAKKYMLLFESDSFPIHVSKET